MMSKQIRPVYNSFITDINLNASLTFVCLRGSNVMSHFSESAVLMKTTKHNGRGSISLLVYLLWPRLNCNWKTSYGYCFLLRLLPVCTQETNYSPTFSNSEELSQNHYK